MSSGDFDSMQWSSFSRLKNWEAKENKIIINIDASPAAMFWSFKIFL